MMTPPFGMDREAGVPLQGVFLWDHFPMALPWAESELPLAGASDLAKVAAGFTFPLPSSSRGSLFHCRF